MRARPTIRRLSIPSRLPIPRTPSCTRTLAFRGTNRSSRRPINRKKAPAGHPHEGREADEPHHLPRSRRGRTCPGGGETVTECQRGLAQHEGWRRGSIHAHCLWAPQSACTVSEAQTQIVTQSVISNRVYCLRSREVRHFTLAKAGRAEKKDCALWSQQVRR